MTNPFTFGALARDEAFTNRESEVAEVGSDMRNGQDVLVYAPRRYGKSSLVLRAAEEAMRDNALVAYCDVMKTPTKERFAADLARSIYEDVASPVGNALERAAEIFRGLRVRPTLELDPDDATLSFSFRAAHEKTDIDDTIERLLELPGELGAERKRRVVVIFDEFQEIVALDRHLPNVMRAVFQTQPEVSHVYLGSKQHLLRRLFNDRNEPFWRSAKQVEVGPIAPAAFAPFIRERFAATDRRIDDAAVDGILSVTAGHPYATQELAYFVWELVPEGDAAGITTVAEALENVLRSEHNHFAQLWDEAPLAQRQLMLALADEPAAAVYSADYHARHELPANPTLQTALAGLTKKEIAGREEGRVHRIVEPFFAEWLRRLGDRGVLRS